MQNQLKGSNTERTASEQIRVSRPLFRLLQFSG